ncbi:hypothetical protein CSUB01_08403 [Colletotrichum sublineola]|uniref:Apple domain-containing protein n=1 Tax=Colletotrichum sublineola TaxID=1173701 RepID=A0A066XRM0_COLSU|nr:hypothetical protein CSUB01_08403 [Colletotrichum sublineola]
MYFLSIYILIPIGAAAALAEQAVLGGGGSNCLSTASYDREATMEFCCPTSSHKGKEPVGSTVFTYTCNQFADPNETAKQASTPGECAQICSEDSSCDAGSWDVNSGRCFITRKGSSYTTVDWPNYILVKKTHETVNKNPQMPKTEDTAQCNVEKGDMEKQMKKDCKKKIKDLDSTHQNALKQAQDRCTDEKAVLEKEKTQCEADKSQKILEVGGKCQTTSTDLEKQLKDCRTKSQGLSGGPDSGSGITGGSGCNYISNNESSFQSCASGCKRFALNGVKYENHCGKYPTPVTHIKAEPNEYGSIQECLEKRCNLEPLCLGVSWNPEEVRLIVSYFSASRI